MGHGSGPIGRRPEFASVGVPPSRPLRAKAARAGPATPNSCGPGGGERPLAIPHPRTLPRSGRTGAIWCRGQFEHGHREERAAGPRRPGGRQEAWRGRLRWSGGPPRELRHLAETDLGEIEVPSRFTPDAVGPHGDRLATREEAPVRRVHADAGDLIGHVGVAGRTTAHAPAGALRPPERNRERSGDSPEQADAEPPLVAGVLAPHPVVALPILTAVGEDAAGRTT